jgi:hypothetical protein
VKTGAPDGHCIVAFDGLDPRGVCVDQGAPSCGLDGTCKSGICHVYDAASPCGVPFCSGESQLATAACDGVGTCVDLPPIDCAPSFRCVDGVCQAACAVDGDCVSTAWCDAAVCQPKSPPGNHPCVAGRECTSGLCVDGYCCNAPCDGQCEACDVDPDQGTCVALDAEDPPEDHGRAACPAPTNDVCARTTCNGTDRDLCRAYAGKSVVCSPKRCEGGTSTAALTCDGAGHCSPPGPGQEEACGAFACGADACLTSCTRNEDCAFGYHCDGQDGTCRDWACDGAHTLTAPDGTSRDCSPFRCQVDAGACVEGPCGSVADCADPFACDATGRCVPRPGSGFPEGNGCQASPGGDFAGARWVLFGLAVAGLVLVGRVGSRTVRRGRRLRG